MNEENNLSAEYVYQNPMYEHPNHHDKKAFCSALKRLLQPYKTFYEVEWTLPNYANATTSKVCCLQLDRQTSSGIERVRRLGFSNLDVRLYDKATKYINKSVLLDRKVDNILIEILFSNSSYWHNDSRKDSVLQSSSIISSCNKEDYQEHLLRLRRVHWWTNDYHLARASCLSS